MLSVTFTVKCLTTSGEGPGERFAKEDVRRNAAFPDWLRLSNLRTSNCSIRPRKTAAPSCLGSMQDAGEPESCG